MTGIDLLADYVFLSKYSQRKANGQLETWDETVDRIYAMHAIKLESLGLLTEQCKEMLAKAATFEKQKKILSSQRGRQFASTNPNSGILKHETKMYNCSSTYIDRVKAFSEIMYLLLCGCGVGYSLHKEYIDKLPVVQPFNGTKQAQYTVEDSIEGWADSIDVLMNALFNGEQPDIWFDQIRPKGTLIDGKFIAPGPKPLAEAHRKIKAVMALAVGRKLTSIEVHDIICHIANAVVSGGVRRSAMIAMFDKDDELMLQAKTGSWWQDNPQRGMANNSILMVADEPLSHAELIEKLKVVRQFGEPGFINVPSYDYTVNPCGEIVMRPSISNKELGIEGPGSHTGFAFCNLVEINAERIDCVTDFYEACTIASFMATVQSLYTNFKYLSKYSQLIAERDRAIGVSITGIMANPLLRKYVLADGAQIVKNINAIWAENFHINKSRACTTIKPSGNASCILGLVCSGIHPAHADHYLRRVRIKNFSPEYKALEGTPLVKLSYNDDAIMSFPIDVKPGIPTKDTMNAIEHLKFIAMVKHYWVNKGIQSKTELVSNNVSATVEVEDNQWDEVAAVMHVNSHLFTGLSLLPKFGDQTYDNAPFQRPLSDATKKEFDDAKQYIATHDIDFNAIMSDRANIFAGDMTAQGCSGGKCELT